MVSSAEFLSVPSMLFKEAKWLDYVTPIFVSSVIEQWSKAFLLDDYKTLHEAVAIARTPKVNLVGHSMGGLNSLAYTINHPEKVENCVMSGTPIAGTTSSLIGATFATFGVYLHSYFQLLPNSDYMKELRKKLNDRIGVLESNNVALTNIWSPIDELVSTDDSSLESMLGRKSRIINEYKFASGHCEIFYGDEPQRIIKGIIADSENDTVLVHGMLMNQKFFNRLLEDIDQKYLEKLVLFSYDYSKSLQI